MTLHFRHFHLISRNTIDLQSLFLIMITNGARYHDVQSSFGTPCMIHSLVERDEIVYVGPVISEVHVQQVNDLPLQTD